MRRGQGRATSVSRVCKVAVVSALATALTGCTEPSGPPEHAPAEAVAFSLFLVLPGAERTYAVKPGWATAPASIRISIGMPVVFTSMVDAGGRPVGLRPPSFRVDVRNPTPPGVLSARGADWKVVELSATSKGGATVGLCLVHADHCDLEVNDVPMVIEE